MRLRRDVGVETMGSRQMGQLSTGSGGEEEPSAADATTEADEDGAAVHTCTTSGGER
jgi:hypothetical protein